MSGLTQHSHFRSSYGEKKLNSGTSLLNFIGDYSVRSRTLEQKFCQIIAPFPLCNTTSWHTLIFCTAKFQVMFFLDLKKNVLMHTDQGIQVCAKKINNNKKSFSSFCSLCSLKDCLWCHFHYFRKAMWTLPLTFSM